MRRYDKSPANYGNRFSASAIRSPHLRAYRNSANLLRSDRHARASRGTQGAEDRHTAVDVTAADWRNCVARGGDPDRRAQGEWRQESQDSWQLHEMLRQRVDSAAWRRSNIRKMARRRRNMMPAWGFARRRL